MPVPITALYLAIFAVFAGVLSSFPGRMRGSTGISIGDGGNPDLLLAMRRQANFVEYVPYLMIMFAAMELNGASATILHGFGIALFVVRICHAFGLQKDSISSPLRAIGAAGTLLVTLGGAGVLVSQYFA